MASSAPTGNKWGGFWANKHQPKTFDDMIFHKDTAMRLKDVASNPELPHLLFHGASGAGKRTMVQALLRQVYGEEVQKMRLVKKPIDLEKSGNKDTIDAIESICHLEMAPHEAGTRDRLLVQHVIKDLAAEKSISGKGFRVVVLQQACRLTHDAQAGLRRTMERYMKTCRIVLVCDNASKIIGPLRSRCLCVRIPAPEDDEIRQFLTALAKKEDCILPDNVREELVRRADGDVRLAINELQMLASQRTGGNNSPLDLESLPERYPWKHELRGAAQLMTADLTKANFGLIRGKLFEVLSAQIPGEMIIRTLYDELTRMPNVTDRMKVVIAEQAGMASYALSRTYEERSMLQLESFCLQVIALFEEYEKQGLLVNEEEG